METTSLKPSSSLGAVMGALLGNQSRRLIRRQEQTVRLPLLEEIHIFNGGFKVPKLLKEVLANDNLELDTEGIWVGYTKRRNGKKEPGPIVKRVQVFYEYRQDHKKYTGEKLRELRAERGCGKRKKKAA